MSAPCLVWFMMFRGSCLFALSDDGLTLCGGVVGLVWLFENSIVCQVCLMPFIF